MSGVLRGVLLGVAVAYLAALGLVALLVAAYVGFGNSTGGTSDAVSLMLAIAVMASVPIGGALMARRRLADAPRSAGALSLAAAGLTLAVWWYIGDGDQFTMPFVLVLFPALAQCAAGALLVAAPTRVAP